MSWFEFIERQNQPGQTRRDAGPCLVSLVTESPVSVPVEQPGQERMQPGNNDRTSGTTSGFITNALRQTVVAGTVPLHIQALNSDSFAVRTRATEALRSALDTDPHIVLPMLIDATRNPPNLEFLRRVQQLRDQYIDRTTTTNGVTRDGLGRVTAFDSFGWNVTINWNRTNLNQIDSFYTENRTVQNNGGVLRVHQPELFERQPDGTYRVSWVNPLTGEVRPVGVARPENIRLTSRLLDYRYRLNDGGREIWNNHVIR